MSDFQSFYLQRATREFAEDIDKARTADDFKADSVPFLIHALQQGAALFPDTDRSRIMAPSDTPTSSLDADVEMAAVADKPSKERKEGKETRRKRKSEGRS